MLSLVEERYAKSLYELAKENKSEKEILEELMSLGEILNENSDFLKLLTSPAIAFSEKKELVSAVFKGKLSDYVESFLLLMTEKGRASSFLGACTAYKEIFNEENGICEAEVTSVIELSTEQQQALSAKLSTLTGKKISLKLKIDTSIIGGLIVKIGNEQIDNSVKTKLWDISSQIKQINA